MTHWAKTTVAECLLTSCVIGSHAKPEQQHQPILTSLSHRCMRVEGWPADCMLGGVTWVRMIAATGGETGTKWESAQNVNFREENSPASSVGNRTRNLWIEVATSPALYQLRYLDLLHSWDIKALRRLNVIVLKMSSLPWTDRFKLHTRQIKI